MTPKTLSAEAAFSLLDALPGNYLVLLPNAPDFTVVAVADAYSKNFGIAREQLVGRSIFQFLENGLHGFDEAYPQQLKDLLNQLLPINEGNRNIDEPYTIRTVHSSARSERHYRAAIKPVLNKEGEVECIFHWLEEVAEAEQEEQTKRLLNNLLTNSPTGISVTQVIRDKNGEIIDGRTIVANKVSEKFVGITVEEMLNRTTSELDPNILKSPIFLKAVETLRTGEPFITQYYFAPSDRWLELSVAKMDDDHLVNIFTDITVLKNAQLEIERSEQRLKAVFNSSQSGMFTFAPTRDEKDEIVDFRFVIVNPSFAAYVGQTPDTLNGQLGSTWFPGYLTNGVFDMYKKTYLTGEAQRIDIHYNVDEHDIYLDLQSTKVGEEVLVTFTDFTPLKKAQIQLEKYVEDLKHSNTNLEEFAYAASHDLKEPIRKIHFFSDRLKNALNDSLTEEQKNLFSRMEVATKRMVALIDDLLSFSQVSLKPKLFEEVDLNQLIDTVLTDLELEIEESGAEIKIDELFTIKGHQRQLQQAFQNLIGNALKYTHPKRKPSILICYNIVQGKELKVPLSPAEQQKSFYAISVKDNGTGFEPAEKDRIFQVFTRLHNSNSIRGTGIGLSIVRKVIENHNGHVTAEGRPGEGATFKVFLPVE